MPRKMKGRYRRHVALFMAVREIADREPGPRLGLAGLFGAHDFEMDTLAGPLGLSVPTDSGSDMGTIFARFADPGRAKALLAGRRGAGRLNPFSGKFNVHLEGPWEPQDLVSLLLADLAPVLADARKEGLCR